MLPIFFSEEERILREMTEQYRKALEEISKEISIVTVSHWNIIMLPAVQQVFQAAGKKKTGTSELLNFLTNGRIFLNGWRKSLYITISWESHT